MEARIQLNGHDSRWDWCRWKFRIHTVRPCHRVNIVESTRRGFERTDSKTESNVESVPLVSGRQNQPTASSAKVCR